MMFEYNINMRGPDRFCYYLFFSIIATIMGQQREDIKEADSDRKRGTNGQALYIQKHTHTHTHTSRLQTETRRGVSVWRG